MVFEYQSSGDWSDINQPIDLWMVNRNGSGAALFVQGGQSPAWSPQAVPVPLPLNNHIYLPLLKK